MSLLLDLTRPRRIHVVGVGGAGMSAIATVLTRMGHVVSGSDLKTSAGLERLRALGVRVAVGHDPANIGDAEAVTISTAVPAGNPEVLEARSRGIPILSRAEALAAIVATRRAVAVSGTHGKTTTSSMLALALLEAGMRPSFLVGGEVNEIGSGAAWDDGDWMVVEADESDGTFLALHPEAVVVTSVEPDHLDHFGSFDAMIDAFRQFLDAPGLRLTSADDPTAAALGAEVGAQTYGSAAGATWRMVDVRPARSSVSFSVVRDSVEVATIALPVPGAHNAANACAALAAAVELGAGTDAVTRALNRYAGVARRFQFKGERDGVTFVDDYAHNPGKVRAVLSAAKAGGWRRVVCVFQPHRYSRTADLWRAFGPALRDADLLVLTDVYGAGEAPRPGITAKLVVNAAVDERPGRRVAYLPSRQALLGFLRAELRDGDLCLTLGAGDITSLADDLLRP